MLFLIETGPSIPASHGFHFQEENGGGNLLGNSRCNGIYGPSDKWLSECKIETKNSPSNNFEHSANASEDQHEKHTGHHTPEDRAHRGRASRGRHIFEVHSRRKFGQLCIVVLGCNRPWAWGTSYYYQGMETYKRSEQHHNLFSSKFTNLWNQNL